MKVLVNRLTALRQKAGMGHYIAELARCLPLTAGADEEVLFYPGPLLAQGLLSWQKIKSRLAGLKKAKGQAASSGGKNAATWKTGLARQLASWHFQARNVRADFDLYHEPNYIPSPCPRPTLATVADLSLLLHPEWHPAERARHFAKNFPAALARCAHVITISEFSRQEIIRQLALPPAKVSCTYMGVRPGLGPLPPAQTQPVLARLGLPEQFFLFVGTLEPRKNLLTLLRAFVNLAPEIRTRCPLVLAGGWGWNAAELAEYFAREARQRGVIHLGYVADADLPALYNAARALVFPSHYEGFGLPPMEMMACGGAVLASTAGAVVETAGPRAHLLDPNDVDGWRDAMARVALDQDWWLQLRQGTQDLARPYTWESYAAQTWKVYRQVAAAFSASHKKAA